LLENLMEIDHLGELRKDGRIMGNNTEEHRLRLFENRVLRRIFGPKRKEVIGDWRRLHNEELHNLYVSPNIIKMVIKSRGRWAGHVACTGQMRNVYNILVRKPEGKRPFKRPRRRWKGNIRMGLREVKVWTGCL
jgi:hypothetical protein